MDWRGTPIETDLNTAISSPDDRHNTIGSLKFIASLYRLLRIKKFPMEISVPHSCCTPTLDFRLQIILPVLLPITRTADTDRIEELKVSTALTMLRVE
jgi:hypothetical protein